MAVRPLLRFMCLCAVVGALGHRQSPGSPVLLDSILAVAEGQVIMLSDVRAFVDLGLVEATGVADPTPLVLTTLIERQLILDEVARFVVDEPTSVQVDTLVKTVVERVGGAAVFARVLAGVGYTVKDLEQVVRDDLRIDRYLARRFPSSTQPTEAEVAARQDLIDDWIASLTIRAEVVRVGR